MSISGLPLVGAQAVIAGMAAFNRDAAQINARVLQINRTAQQLERETGGAFAGLGDQFAGLAGTLATGGAIIAGAFAAATVASVKFAADFEQSLAFTGAITNATAEQMSQLHDAIIRLSRDGTLGINDLSTAATELGRAGVPIEGILGGALKAVQDLAIASGGELGLAAAAKLVATSLNAFNLEATESERVTTAATVVAQKSSATFTGFGEGVAIAGASFRAAGFTLEDLAIGLTILTQRGMSASVAATALRGLIQRLEKPSKDAAKVMQEYGIHLFDAAGKGVGFRAVLGQLNEAFSDEAVLSGRITEAQRAQALAALGLQRTSVALFSLAVEGTDAYDELRRSFDDLSASGIVEKLLKPLNAQMEIAKNNVMALAVSFGEGFLASLHQATAALVPFLQGLSLFDFKLMGEEVALFGQALVTWIIGHVQGLMEFINTLAQLPGVLDAVKGAVVVLGAVIIKMLIAPLLSVLGPIGLFFAALVAGVAIFQHFAPAINNLGVAFANWLDSLGPIGNLFGNLVRSILMGLDAISRALRGDFIGALNVADQAFSRFFSSKAAIIGTALEGIGQGLDAAGVAVQTWAASVGVDATGVGLAFSGIHGFVQSLQFLLQGNFAAAGQAAEGAIKNLTASIEPLATLIGTVLNNALTQFATTALPPLQAALQWLVTNVPLVANAFSTSLVNVITTSVLPALQGFADAIKRSLDFAEQTGSIQALQEAFKQLGSAFEAIGAILGGLKGAIGGVDIQLAQIDTPAQRFLASIAALNKVVDILGAGLRLLSAVILVVASAFNGAAQLARVTGDAFNVIGSQYIPQLISDFTTLNSAITNTFTSFVATVVGAGVAIAFAVGAFFSELGSTVSAGLNAIRQFFIDTWNSIPEDIRADLATVTGILATGLGEWLTSVANVMGQIDAAIKGALDGIVAGLAGFWASFLATNEANAQRDLQNNQQQMAAMQEVFTSGWNALVNIVTAAGSAINAAVVAFGSLIIETLNGIVGLAHAAAMAIGTAIVNGVVAGFNALRGYLGEQAAALARSALNAAKAALGASSPSREFEELGTASWEGYVAGLKKGAGPTQEAARSLMNQALAAARDATDKATQIMDDLATKTARIGEDVGRKINEAIIEAAKSIDDALKDAESRIADLNDSLAISRRDRARRDKLNADQQAKRDARKQEQEDKDAIKDKAKAIKDAEFQLQQDLAVADTDAEKKRAQEKFDARIQDIQRDFDLEQQARAERRQREIDDKIFEQTLDDEQRALDKQLEDEALGRAIERTIKERDARITSINEALAEKQKQLREQADREIKEVREDALKKIDILQKDFVDKANDLLAKGGAAMAPLIDAIQQSLSQNFDEMRASAGAFTDEVNLAIAALNALQQLQSSFDAPDIPTDEGENAPIPSFQHGGVVPGAFGKRMLAWVHAGETVSGLMGEARSMMSNLNAYGAGGSNYTNNVTYQVNPTYENVQSPASVALDMQALILRTRG